MDRALPGGGGGEMNVLERQLGSASLTNNKWQPQQLQLQELQSLMLNDSSNHSISQTKQFLTRDIGDNDVINKYENLTDARSDRVVNCSMMTKINNLGVGLDHRDNLLSSGSLGEFIQLPRIGFDGVDEGFVSIGVEKAKLAKGGEMGIAARMAPSTVVASEKKRKADKAQYPKVVAEEVTGGKKIKRDAEEVEFNNKVYDQAKTNMKNRETSADTSSKEETSKATSDQVQKPDYIHVRARRGQATDSHSLAERMRREKISARMKYLQDLVPGCNKIIGKAGMLDEIINYVQSLQRQVEFLSMKLATINSTLDFNVENFFTKEAQIFQAGTENYPPMGILTEIVHPAYLQFNPSQRVVSCSGLEMTIDPSSEINCGRTSIVSEEASMDSSCFTQAQPSSTYWETDCQGIYSVGFNQRRLPAAFPSQQFTGLVETNNLMMMKKM